MPNNFAAEIQLNDERHKFTPTTLLVLYLWKPYDQPSNMSKLLRNYRVLIIRDLNVTEAILCKKPNFSILS